MTQSRARVTDADCGMSIHGPCNGPKQCSIEWYQGRIGCDILLLIHITQIMHKLCTLCKYYANIMQKLRRNYAEIMQKLCRNYVYFMQIMQILCRNYAEIMQKLCKNYAEIRSSRGVTLSGLILLLSHSLAKGRGLYRKQGVYSRQKCAEPAPDWATGWCELSSATSGKTTSK